MKGEKKETKKNKRLYLAALCGVLAVSGAVYAGTRGMSQNEPEKNLVDLNEEPTKAPVLQQEPEGQTESPAGDPAVQDDNLAVKTDGEDPEGASNPELPQKPAATQPPVQKPEASQGVTAQGSNQEAGGDTAELTAQNEKGSSAELPDNSMPNEETASVMNPAADDLKFSDEEGLCWPVEGNVVKNYSADQMVYFETLQQFRTNPAIFISGEVGADVVAAADGIVQEIRKEDKTGQTLVLDIGSGYSLVYGHLADVAVKGGDYLEAGSTFAKLAPVTKYYQIEGNHLYFQVLKDGETVNPMLLIQ